MALSAPMTFEDLIHLRMRRLPLGGNTRRTEEHFARQAMERLPSMMAAVGWGAHQAATREFLAHDFRLDALFAMADGRFVICEMKNTTHARKGMMAGSFILGQLLTYGAAFAAQFRIEPARVRLAAVLPADNLWLNTTIGQYNLPIHVFVIGTDEAKFYGAKEAEAEA